MTTSRIAIASDHAGYDLKAFLMTARLDLQWIDLGTANTESTDYPVHADKLVSTVIKENIPGILICGSGVGMSIRANRFVGIRAALCLNETMARLSREHNDANVLCMGSRLLTSQDQALDILEVFLNTPFAGGRHINRVKQLDFPTKIN
jgi:ribose 5-phosphate isomerase B